VLVELRQYDRIEEFSAWSRDDDHITAFDMIFDHHFGKRGDAPVFQDELQDRVRIVDRDREREGGSFSEVVFVPLVDPLFAFVVRNVRQLLEFV